MLIDSIVFFLQYERTNPTLIDHKIERPDDFLHRNYIRVSAHISN